MSRQHDGEAELDLAELHSLPPGWCWTTLATIACIDGGITKDQKRQRTPTMREVPYLRVANVQRGYLDLGEIKSILADADEIEALRLQQGDILFTEGGDRDKLGRGWVWNGEIEDCIHQNHIFRARPCLALLEPKFVSFHGNFFGQKWFTRTGKQTTNLASINKGVLSRFPVPLAPLNEQRRIVARMEELFSDIDAGVAALERARAKLHRYRAAVLKAAVEGRLTAEWRARHSDTEPASKLLDRLLSKRRRRWEADQEAKFAAAEKTPPKNWREKYLEPTPPDASNLPKLPGGWCWVGFAQVAVFQNGRPFPSKEYTDEGVKLVRPGNLIEDGSVQWTDKNTKCLPPRWAEENGSHIVRAGELIMNLTAQSLKDEFLGRTCITGSDELCLLNQRLARITPLQGLNPKFTLAVLKSAWFRRFVSGLNTGSLIQHMFTSQLDEFCFPLAPEGEQEQIVAEIEARLSQVVAAEKQIEANLRRAFCLRQSILKRAFEGKLVPQDPQDEPASALLERIKAERQVGPVGRPSTNGRKNRRRAGVEEGQS